MLLLVYAFCFGRIRGLWEVIQYIWHPNSVYARPHLKNRRLNSYLDISRYTYIYIYIYRDSAFYGPDTSHTTPLREGGEGRMRG